MLDLRGNAALVVVGLVTFSCGGRGGPQDGGVDPRDIRGNYAIQYDNRLKLSILLGGGVRTVEAGTDAGTIDFGYINGQPVTLDLSAYCARPEVTCPSEAFWKKVAIDQPNLQQNNFNLQVMTVIDDTVHVLDAGQRAAAAGGLVDHGNADRFLLGLGLNGGASQACAALAASFSHGRFTHVGETVSTVTVYRYANGQACNPDGGAVDGGAPDAGGLPDGGQLSCNGAQVQQINYPAGAAVSGIAEGKVSLAWAGGCAFGPVLAGAVLLAETGYTGTRTGNYDPPPFTPAPVVQPDAGLETDGGAIPTGCDGGNPDGGC